MNRIDISVVIPTFNREELLSRSVPLYANQQAGDFTYEVIFVMNGSTDGSEAVLHEASRSWPEKIRYLSIPPSGSPAAPRNAGIRAVKGNALIIVDDDVLPDPDFIFQHARFHQLHPEPHYAALGKLCIPEASLSAPESFFHEFISYDHFRRETKLHFLDFWTCNVSLKRDFMLRYGMFDESMAYFEDGLCGFHLASHGMELYYLPEASGVHLHHMNLNPDSIRKKGAIIGKTLRTFEQLVPDAELQRRYGILSKQIGTKAFVLRALKRMLLYSLSNSLLMAVLEPIALSSRQRSRFTDAYYYLIFRRSILQAYSAARRQGRHTAHGTGG